MTEEFLKPLEEKTLAEKLFLVRFKVDSASHLILDKEVCWECGERACLSVCPTEVYKWEEGKKEITVSYEGCLECGTCRIACSEGAIDWRNPRGGFGVSLRFG
ncbi:MAG: 4Fe-4S dicluster domain-containing protein [Deltaproteobacteria bacterium]|nr:4Fe-4S dicluster domain-containing protein [Deltaproteobacteria bacterium]